MYENANPLFKDFIYTFCVKDDTDLKNMLLNIDASIDLKYAKNTYLATYVDTYYKDTYLNEIIISYENLLLKYLEDIENNLENLKNYVSNTYYYRKK